MNAGRLSALRRRLPEAEIDALMVTQPENRRYLSGFTGSTGALFISASTAALVTDFRYLEQAAQEAAGFSVVRMNHHDPYGTYRELLAGLGVRRLGFEATHLSFAQHEALQAALKDVGVTLIPTRDLVERLRMIKDASELAQLRRAVALADQAIAYAAAEVVRPGISERAVAWAIERHLREAGADGPAFDTIVASGPNAALPHHRAGDRLLEADEPVIIDMGALTGGYRSDITRTLWCGRPPARLREIYTIVFEAQQTAAAGVRAGMSAREADALARNPIARAGFGEAFGHSLGHGIGLAVHEPPLLGETSQDELANGMVFSIEPGIYLPGWGGVRIEDLVLLEDGRPQILTGAAKLAPY